MSLPARKLLLPLVLVCGLGLALAPRAEAGWYWGHGCCWGYGWHSTWYAPVYTTSYSYYGVGAYDPCCGYGSWYVGLRPGPIRRLLFGPYRWYWNPGCCSVCYADPCCCYDGGTVVSVGSTPSAAHESQKPTLAPSQDPSTSVPAAPEPQGTWPTPATPPTQSAPTPGLPGAGTPNEPAGLGVPGSTSRGSSQGTISILVPEDARVTINGYLTTSSGRVRRYVSQNLKPGLVYPFEIVVTAVRDGRVVSQTQHVKLTGGALEAVVFDFAPTSVEGIAQAL